MATILDLALPDGSNLLADLQHTPAKSDKGFKGSGDPRASANSNASVSDHGKREGEASNELVFKLVKKEGGFAIRIGTEEARVLLAMLAAGAKAP